MRAPNSFQTQDQEKRGKEQKKRRAEKKKKKVKTIRKIKSDDGNTTPRTASPVHQIDPASPYVGLHCERLKDMLVSENTNHLKPNFVIRREPLLLYHQPRKRTATYS